MVKRKIAVVEDEISWQTEIVAILENLYEECEINRFFSGEEFLFQGVQEYDLIFLDIELPGMSGMDVAGKYNRIYPGSILIILTAHLEHSREGYRVNAFRFVDKLNMKLEMEEAVASAERRLGEQKIITLHIVNIGDMEILCHNIRYFETCKRNLLVHGVNDSFICSNNISTLAQQLREDGFLYIHRSYLVNVHYVRRFLEKDVLLDNGEKIMVSARKHADMKKQFIMWKSQRGLI